MCLAPAPIYSSACTLADWIEFKVLISEFSFYRITELERLSDTEQDEENPNISEQDANNEIIVESVLNTLATREQCLEQAYPYEFNHDQTELRLRDKLSLGCYVYLYCLFMSHVQPEDVLTIKPPSTNRDRDIMQICSTLAAANIVKGNSVSFGFPRPNHTDFLPALKSAYKKMGEGVTYTKIPNGAPANQKDGKVDIIAWGTSVDNAPGKIYLLGQVASGENWREKSVKGSLDFFHDTWFIRKPASTPIPAMFIPFCIDKKTGASYDDTIHYLVSEFGQFSHRYRLPLEAELGYKQSQEIDADLYIQRTDEINKIKDYVNNFRHTLRP